MSTNKEAFNKSIIKKLSVNYKLVFKRYGYNSLDTLEYEKLYKYLKPLCTILDEDYIIFKYPKQNKLLKLL